MKVYLLYTGDYEDRRVQVVTKTLEAAKKLSDFKIDYLKPHTHVFQTRDKLWACYESEVYKRGGYSRPCTKEIEEWEIVE